MKCTIETFIIKLPSFLPLHMHISFLPDSHFVTTESLENETIPTQNHAEIG